MTSPCRPRCGRWARPPCGRAGSADATALIDEAIEAADAAGNDWEAGLTLAAKAAIAVRQNKLKSAQRSYEAALEVLSDNNRWGVAQIQYGLGTAGPGPGRRRHGGAALRGRRGDLPRAGRLARDRPLPGRSRLDRAGRRRPRPGPVPAGRGLRLNQTCGQRLGIARGLEAFAALAAARQQPEQAARLAGAACQLRESLGQPTGIGSRVEALLDLARDRLGAAAAAALFAEGREMTADDAVGYALGSHIETAAGLPASPEHARSQGAPAGPAMRPGPTRPGWPRPGQPRRSPRASTRSWSSSPGACPTGRSPTSW